MCLIVPSCRRGPGAVETSGRARGESGERVIACMNAGATIATNAVACGGKIKKKWGGGVVVSRRWPPFSGAHDCRLPRCAAAGECRAFAFQSLHGCARNFRYMYTFPRSPNDAVTNRDGSSVRLRNCVLSQQTKRVGAVSILYCHIPTKDKKRSHCYGTA